MKFAAIAALASTAFICDLHAKVSDETTADIKTSCITKDDSQDYLSTADGKTDAARVCSDGDQTSAEGYDGDAVFTYNASAAAEECATELAALCMA